MTITYTGNVANAQLFGFSRLLLYWKGSIYKLMYKEMLVFCVIYAILSLIYRFALDAEGKRVFEQISLYCDGFSNLIPLSFVLGFYVAICVARWWDQYLNIPWPDRVVMYVATMIDGADDRGKILRRTIMRYLNLSCIIVFQATSVVVKKRFPTMEHLVEAGLITEHEITAMNDVHTPHGKWWLPIVWICNIIKAARKEGRIVDTYTMKTLIDEVQIYRGHLGMLFSYDWISVPLVYTQVTTLAVYMFFLSCLFGRQFLDPSMKYSAHTMDLYIPVFTILQFFFYMGWLKVAEQMINPFGEDDDDFEMNWVIDRNLQLSLMIVDDLFDVYPQPEKDVYFNEEAPENLPYTKSTIEYITKPHMGSTNEISVTLEGMQLITPMDIIPESDSKSSANQGHFPAYQSVPHSTSPTNHHRLQYPNMITGCERPIAHDSNKGERGSARSSSKSNVTSSHASINKRSHASIKHKRYSSSVLNHHYDPHHVPHHSPPDLSHLATSVDTALYSSLLMQGSRPINVPNIIVQDDGVPSRLKAESHRPNLGSPREQESSTREQDSSTRENDSSIREQDSSSLNNMQN